MHRLMTQACIGLGLLIPVCGSAQVEMNWSDTETLITKARLDGVEYEAVVDTGASTFTVTEAMAAKILAGRKSQPVSIGTLTGGRVGREYQNIPMVAVGLPSRVGRVTTCSDLELDRISQIYGHDIRFLVGMPILKGCVLSFDNYRAVLTETMPSLSGPHIELPLSFFRSEVPQCRGMIGTKYEMLLIVDTGCDTQINIDTTIADSLCATDDAIRLLRDGESGEGTAELIVIREVEVFGTKHRNVPASIGRANVVGFGLLRHMKFTLDFPNRRVLVPDPPQAGLDWFPIDASGLRIVRKEDRITRIRRIVENSTGDEADVKVGDVIVAVNGTPALELSRYAIEEQLSKAGTTVRLDLERDGKALTIDVPLKHPFEYPPKWPPRPEPSKDQLDFEKFIEEQEPNRK